MTNYAIQAVRTDRKSDRIVGVRWRVMDLGAKDWLGPRKQASVKTVVYRIQAGDRVHTLHTVDGKYVAGTEVNWVTYHDGVQGIEDDAIDKGVGRSLRDLPRF